MIVLFMSFWFSLISQPKYQVHFDRDINDLVLTHIHSNYSHDEILEIRKSKFIPLDFTIDYCTYEIQQVSHSEVGLLFKKTAGIPIVEDKIVEQIIQLVLESNIKILEINRFPKKPNDVNETIHLVIIINLDVRE